MKRSHDKCQREGAGEKELERRRSMDFSSIHPLLFTHFNLSFSHLHLSFSLSYLDEYGHLELGSKRVILFDAD
jgi:hypothetical protein